MKTVSARELKNRTGDIISKARAGEQYLVTVHGKPAAAIMPAGALEAQTAALRPADEAWRDIESTLEASKPKFETYDRAMAWVRKRS